ncbi:penicillin binding protein transpeptidase domain-containing protein [Leptospira noguchii]|uniref:penicillin-binding transpeptidase domain-containing protein n=1 Tax=Leptospira noguchii TaxID=28182 RepID=UPI0003287952|nr:penicillin-binding transpeptidase domain-containing protein [Leptospira noguchii]EMS89143.1 penicillin-binding protein, transpeptidase domain protein [Leptospira noguchii str. Cascata]UOG39085.1 penicillin binding protein transpeptidase domain-containing protein [Leptospira noguchii]
MKNGFLSFLVILLFLSCKTDSSNSSLNTKSFSEKSLKGNFCAILVNQTTNNKIYFQKDECFHKTPPSSLFHSALALISVEGGYLKENQTLFFWDKTRYPYIRWQKDQNLKSALEYSVHWYFTNLWNDIGPEKGKPLLEKIEIFQIPNTRNSFWSDGSYTISPSEFVDFLIRLQETPPPIRKKTIQSVWDLLKRTPGSFSNATGSHDLSGDWNGVEDYRSDSAFYYTQEETSSWFWVSFQKSNVRWLLLTRIRISQQITNPLKAAELASKILKDELIIP